MWRDLFRRPRTAGKIARDMIARGNRARDGADYSKAALLYEEALRIRPRNARIHVQCGHMLKEAGDFANAERHYPEASQRGCGAEIWSFLQGRRAIRPFCRSLSPRPRIDAALVEPARELEQLT